MDSVPLYPDVPMSSWVTVTEASLVAPWLARGLKPDRDVPCHRVSRIESSRGGWVILKIARLPGLTATTT